MTKKQFIKLKVGDVVYSTRFFHGNSLDSICITSPLKDVRYARGEDEKEIFIEEIMATRSNSWGAASIGYDADFLYQSSIDGKVTPTIDKRQRFLSLRMVKSLYMSAFDAYLTMPKEYFNDGR